MVKGHGCLKILNGTTLCGRVTISIFKRLILFKLKIGIETFPTLSSPAEV